MPTYTVRLSDGRTVKVKADKPPTEAEVLAQVGPKQDALIDVNTDQLQGMGDRILDTATDALPNAGGLAGTLVGQARGGKLGSTIGAGIGGGVGDVARQGIDALRGRGEPLTLRQRAASVAGAAGTQAGVEGATKGIVAPAAKVVYGVAMRPLQALRQKYGLRNLIDAGFENRIMPTKGGAAKAGEKVAESRAAQDAMAAAHDAKWTRINPQFSLDPNDAATRGLGPLRRRAQEIERVTGAESGAQRISDQWQNVVTNHPRGMSATGMMSAKRAADAVADPAYIAASKPGGSPVMPGSTPEIAKGWSKGYREVLNDEIGPEFALQGQNTKTMFGVQRMADYAAERPEMASNIMSLVAGGASGGGDFGETTKDALLYRALLSPRVGAGIALGAVPAVRYGGRVADMLTGSQLDRGMSSILMSLLAGEQQAP